MADVANTIHLDFDGAWETASLHFPTLDLRDWGSRVRYIAPPSEIEALDEHLGDRVPPFILFGSGDFHHLSGLWVRRAGATSAALTVVSFDNHPDWDVRPPKWSCGGWINRALDLPAVKAASVWGLGNFELAFPSRLFANRRALKIGRLTVHPWAERQPSSVRKRFDCMTRDDWKDRFDGFAASLAGTDVYVTVDIDCLRSEEAATNWENGLFTAADVAWAIGRMRAYAKLVAGDLCGAYSPQAYARRFQRFAGRWDHPRQSGPTGDEARRLNAGALQTIWPALVGG